MSSAELQSQENQVVMKFMPATIEEFSTIQQSVFFKLFERATLHLALRNAISLLEVSIEDLKGDTQFILRYADDEVSGTLEVLKLKREFLYKSFKQENLQNTMHSMVDKRRSVKP